MEGVPDRMRYNLKVTAAESTNKLTSAPCDGTDFYRGDPTSVISFIIPHSSFSEFVDPVMSRIRFILQVSIPELATNSLNADGQRKECLFLDRGMESLVRRLWIEDMNGNRLEDIDHYNCLYAITELCTSEPEVRKTRGRFSMECFQPTDCEHGTEVWPDQLAKANSNGVLQPRTYEVCFNLISGVFGGTCEKYWPLKAINGLRINIQLENMDEAFNYRFFASRNDTSVLHHATAGGTGVRGLYADATHNIAENIPRKTIVNGENIEIVPLADMSLEERLAANEARWSTASGLPRTRWSRETHDVELTAAAKQEFSYSITRPTIQLNRIYMPGGTGDAIVQAAKNASPDGKIRIQTHGWMVLQSQILLNQNVFDYMIPIHRASLKAVFFTITPQNNIGNMSRSKTQFIQRGMETYQFYYADEPIINQPVRVQFPNTEAYHELMRAWNVAHKTMDAPTLITPEEYNENMTMNQFGFFKNPSSCVYGVDLESFAAKNNVMDSGINTKNTTLRINMTFRAATDRDRREWGDACVIRFYCLYDMFLSIDDSNGSVFNEY